MSQIRFKSEANVQFHQTFAGVEVEVWSWDLLQWLRCHGLTRDTNLPPHLQAVTCTTGKALSFRRLLQLKWIRYWVLLEIRVYHHHHEHVERGWRDERTATTGKNACNQETMMKIGVVIIFVIVQVVLAKQHTSRRSMDTATEADRAVWCNQNAVTNSLSNILQILSAEAQAKTWGINTHRKEVVTPEEMLQTEALQRKTMNLIKAKVCQTTSSMLASQKTAKRSMNVSWVTRGKIVTTGMTLRQQQKMERSLISMQSSPWQNPQNCWRAKTKKIQWSTSTCRQCEVCQDGMQCENFFWTWLARGLMTITCCCMWTWNSMPAFSHLFPRTKWALDKLNWVCKSLMTSIQDYENRTAQWWPSKHSLWWHLLCIPTNNGTWFQLR